MEQKLINAVVQQLGCKDSSDDDCLEILRDVLNHGADQGLPGFTYHSETVDFFQKNRRLITEQLKDDAENMGVSGVQSLVMGFRCASDLTEEEIGRTLWGFELDQHAANCLAWYALEAVAHYVIEELEGIA